MNYVDVGFGNFIEAGKVITVSRPDSSPIRRLVAAAKDEGRYVDLTQGKKTRSIIISACGNDKIVTASAVQTSTVVSRINKLLDKKFVEIQTEEIIEITGSSQQD